MFWKILLFIVAGLILILGVIKAWRDARQEKLSSKPAIDLIITVLLAFLVGFFPLPQLLVPSEIERKVEPIPEMAERQKRIEYKLDTLLQRTQEPTPYDDGIPQSENLDLRKVFDEGKKCLKKYEYDKAIKAFRAALALRDIKPSEAAAVLIYKGIAEYKQSKWDQALGSWKDALSATEEAEDEDGQAAALGNLGIAYQSKGEWDKAIEFYNKSLEIDKKIGDEHGMAQTFNNLGNVYQLKGEWDKAIEFFNNALKGLEKIGDEHGMAQTYGNLGNVYADKGEWDKAIEFYNKTLEIDKKIGDEHGMAKTKGNIGILYKKQGKKEEARRLLEESLRTLEKIGDRPNAEIVREHLKDL